MSIPSRREGPDESISHLPSDLLPLFSDSFVRSCDHYEEYIFRLALTVFRRAKLDVACEQPATTAEAIARAGLDERSARVPLDWILRELASRDVLHIEREQDVVRYRLRGPLPELSPDAIAEEQSRHDAGVLASYRIAALAAEHYPAVLRGEITGERALFGSNGIGAWLDYFASDNILYAISNEIGAFAAVRAFPERGGAILEIGGGLGSGTATLLDRLAAEGHSGSVTSYRFTEVSLRFLRHAQEILSARFSDRPLTFARLDMNRPFADGNAGEGAHALVYGVNTVHVAHDLAFTLAEIRKTLAPGGSLVLSECVRPFPERPIYVEFVFNLLEAFRSPKLDAEWRPNGGFLTPEQWTMALEANGFENVRIVPDIAALRDVNPSFIIAAIVASRA